MSLDQIFRRPTVSESKEEHWIPLSDLMTGLMMMFMLIAVMFMVKVEADSRKVRDVAVLYDAMKTKLYFDLQKEFANDLPKWGAELDKDLTLRFREPEVLFDTGKDSLKPRFLLILDDFFPRYVKILASEKYRDSIEEIRVEGHTSSAWHGATSRDDAYFLNMELSQSRTRSVLRYALSRPSVVGDQDWLRSHVTANGLSSSKLIVRSDGSENAEGSQRVEFRVRTNADERITEILRTVQQ